MSGRGRHSAKRFKAPFDFTAEEPKPTYDTSRLPDESEYPGSDDPGLIARFREMQESKRTPVERAEEISVNLKKYSPRGYRGKIQDQYIIDTVLAAIEMGAWDWVACRAAGIDPQTFKKWLANPDPLYQRFTVEVEKARARAILMAELRIYHADPEKWLKHGPGRDRGIVGEPGWTSGGSKAEVVVNASAVETPIAIDLNRLSAEEARQLRALADKAYVREDKNVGIVDAEVVESKDGQSIAGGLVPTDGPDVRDPATPSETD